MRRHSSFLLRCWDLDQSDERIEIEHIQDRSTTLVHSINAAVSWIRATHHDNAGHRTDGPVAPPTDGEPT